jgi:hypothetical protein
MQDIPTSARWMALDLPFLRSHQHSYRIKMFDRIEIGAVHLGVIASVSCWRYASDASSRLAMLVVLVLRDTTRSPNIS